ncbi:MAG: hypothetical protein D6711_00410 [Chloroflexi bacterium]|nr:MAG: hypothetical protein D6711_00410 [Chloroflexota bacterium]
MFKSARGMYKNLSKVPMLPLLAVVVMVFSLFISSNLSTRRQTTNVSAAPVGGDLYFASQQLNLEPNSTGTYDIYLTTRDGYEVSAVDISLSVDSPVIEISGVELVGEFPLELMKDVSGSTAHIVAGATPGSPFSGTGLVARLNLSAGSQSGNATISFGESTQLAAVGVSGNALGTASSSVVVVGVDGAGSVSSPTPTNTPTPRVRRPRRQIVTPTPTSVPIEVGVEAPLGVGVEANQ